MSIFPTPQPFMVSQGQGGSYNFMAAQGKFVAVGSQTAGRFLLIERTIPAGNVIIPHTHHLEDESFWMLSRSATFQSGDKVMEATAGAFVYFPRGLQHSIKMSPTGPVHMLVLVTPSGLENYLEELSAYGRSHGAPDIAEISAIAAKYQIAIPVPKDTRLPDGHLPHQ
jgi:quercetin dioxygenase-like cupin family protein